MMSPSSYFPSMEYGFTTAAFCSDAWIKELSGFVGAAIVPATRLGRAVGRGAALLGALGREGGGGRLSTKPVFDVVFAAFPAERAGSRAARCCRSVIFRPTVRSIAARAFSPRPARASLSAAPSASTLARVSTMKICGASLTRASSTRCSRSSATSASSRNRNRMASSTRRIYHGLDGMRQRPTRRVSRAARWRGLRASPLRGTTVVSRRMNRRYRGGRREPCQ